MRPVNAFIMITTLVRELLLFPFPSLMTGHTTETNKRNRKIMASHSDGEEEIIPVLIVSLHLFSLHIYGHLSSYLFIIIMCDGAHRYKGEKRRKR